MAALLFQLFWFHVEQEEVATGRPSLTASQEGEATIKHLLLITSTTSSLSSRSSAGRFVPTETLPSEILSSIFPSC